MVYNITVNLDRPNISQIIVKKNDKNSRKLIFHILASGKKLDIAAIYTGTIKATKPDQSIVYDVLSIENGEISYVVPVEMTNAVGEVSCEIQLYGSGEANITSFPIYLTVQSVAFDESELISTDHVEAFRSILNMFYKIYGEMQETTDGFEIAYGSLDKLLVTLEGQKEEYETYIENLKRMVEEGYFNGERGPQGEKGADAVVAEFAGIIGFQILEGNLICYYYDKTPPPFEINQEGSLIYNIGG